jgi:signal transduction histidine kinase
VRRSRSLEWWIAVVRLCAVPFAVFQVALTNDYPEGYEAAAWTVTGVLAVGAVALYPLARRDTWPRLPYVAMSFDFAVISAYTLLFAFEPGTPTRQLLFLAIVMGAARFGMAGGILVAVAAVPVSAWFEARRAHYFHVDYRVEFVTFQAGAGLLMAMVTGWLYSRLNEQRVEAEQRATEAEALRDELGRRADLLDASNRCARALSSSLDLDEAFQAFIRELRGLVPFDRMGILLVEEGTAQIIANAGEHIDDIYPKGSRMDLHGTLIEEIVATGQPVYREDMADSRYVEEPMLVAAGMRARLAAPLFAGTRPVGMLALLRKDASSFQPHEIELVTLLGRLVASAVQNLRAYEGERRTVDELRRLSALRADFVSLVSHELRSPMAAVIGAARTLQARWRELQPDQREAFLALIGDETTRLAALIGDVLDTSRIDAGTFSYRFGAVDVGAIVQETVAAAAVGQDEVSIVARVPDLPAPIRGDPERLRQVFVNLVDNAVKYSPAGQQVDVRVAQSDGHVVVSVSDRGPGIPSADQRLIFEKFGRVSHGATKPGTGLGLFIARSITEAHGGTIDISSAPGRGSTFTVTLPR